MNSLHPLTPAIFAIVSMFAAPVDAAEASATTVSRVEFEVLQERTQKLENDLIVQRQVLQLSLDSSDKRLADFGALATMQGSQTTWVGNVVAAVGMLVTFIVAVAGLLIYVNVARRAKAEAREYFEEHSAELQHSLQGLKEEVAKARAGIVNEVVQVSAEANAAREEIAAATELMSAATDVTLDRDDEPSKAQQIVKKASEHLKEKPESSFSANDFFIRGASLYADGKYASALDYFDDACKHSADQPIPQQLRYLLAKTAALDKLRMFDEGLAVCDYIIGTYSNDQSEEVQEHVAAALITKGVYLGQRGENDEALKTFAMVEERYKDYNATPIRTSVARAILNRSIAALNQEYLEEADRAADVLLERYRSDDDPLIQEVVAGALNNKAIILGKKNLFEEQLAAYGHIEALFSSNPAANVQQRLSIVRCGFGYAHILNAKRNWQDLERRNASLREAITILNPGLDAAPEQTRWIIHGNIGYAYFLLHVLEQAHHSTAECLQLGRKAALEAQQKDALIERVEPDDLDYETMLSRLWRDISASHRSSE